MEETEKLILKRKTILHRKLTSRKKFILYTNAEVKAFLKLFDDPVIKDFLELDTCCMLADKYLLAMVFVYFTRAHLPIHSFNRLHFFAALYLGHDMEEDTDVFKFNLLPWSIGGSLKNKKCNLFLAKQHMWKLMSYKCLVSRACCEEVIKAIPHHFIWERDRDEVHCGANRIYNLKNKKCKLCASETIGLTYEWFIFDKQNHEECPSISESEDTEFCICDSDIGDESSIFSEEEEEVIYHYTDE